MFSAVRLVGEGETERKREEMAFRFPSDIRRRIVLVAVTIIQNFLHLSLTSTSFVLFRCCRTPLSFVFPLLLGEMGGFLGLLCLLLGWNMRAWSDCAVVSAYFSAFLLCFVGPSVSWCVR